MRRALTIVLVLVGAVLSATTGRGFTSLSEVARQFAAHDENALEKRLFADAADGRLDEFSPLAAALVASGVDNATELRRYQKKAKSLAEELRRADDAAGSPLRQIEAVFDFLHRRVLRGGYDLAATDLRVALDRGHFNCVSATVLFNYFGGELGLKCRGLEMPSHAMSRVLLPGGAIDIETTCPRWVQVAADAQRQTAVATGTIGAASAADHARAREVSPIQLAAMIYYNRGVDLLAEKRFAEAAAANAKSLRLDPGNATARGNLLATINNWSIHLGDSGQFAEAVELLRQGLAIDRHFDPFAQNCAHVYHQWAEQLCRNGRFDEALAILARAKAALPDCSYLRQAISEVQQRAAIAAGHRDGPPGGLPCIAVESSEE